MKILTSLFVLGLAMVSCTRKSSVPTDKGPEEVVRQFLELSSKAKEKEDRVKLQALCSGELHRAFDRMTDEAFQMSYLNSNVHIKDLKFLEAKQEAETAKILYEIAIENKQGTDATQEINKREVELTRAEGYWQIESIRAVGSDNIAFTRGMIF